MVDVLHMPDKLARNAQEGTLVAALLKSMLDVLLILAGLAMTVNVLQIRAVPRSRPDVEKALVLLEL